MPAVDLTPGEALVLLDPNKKCGREAIKISLMWLLANKFLTASQRHKPGFLGKLSKATYLAPGGRVRDRLSAEMSELMRLVGNARTMHEFVRAARVRFGADLDVFCKQYLLKSLIGRRLVEARTEPFLFAFSRTGCHLTRAGEAMRQRVDGLLTNARDIPGYLDTDPRQAAALAATLGGLIFLVPELRPHFDDIAAVMRRSANTDTSTYVGDTSGPSPALSKPTPDEPMDWSLSGFDAGAFDALDAGIASFDAAVSGDAGGGGDGGGGGGGGD